MPRMNPEKASTSLRMLWWAAAAVTALGLTGCSSSVIGASGGGSDDAGFVAKIRQDARATSGDTTGLLAGAILAAEHPAKYFSALPSIHHDAQSLHDHLFDFRDQLLGTASPSHSDQMDLVNAENDLKNAAGSIATWAAAPTSDNATTWLGQMQIAVSEWNRDVRRIWRAAAAGTPPTIGFAR